MEIKGVQVRVNKEPGSGVTEVFVHKATKDSRGAVNFSTYLEGQDNSEESGTYDLTLTKVASAHKPVAAEPEEEESSSN